MKFFYLILIVLLYACKKEIAYTSHPLDGLISAEGDSLVAFHDWNLAGNGMVDVPQFIDDTIQYKFPVFNPLNDNEFIYWYADNYKGLYRLYKYNLLTKQKQLLAENLNVMYQPAWNRQGRIAFETSDYNIYIMQDDGSQLELFHQSGWTGFSRRCEWLAGSDRLFWKKENPNNQKWFLTKTVGQTTDPDTLIKDAPVLNWYSANYSGKLMIPGTLNHTYYSLNLKTSGEQQWSGTDFQVFPYVPENSTIGLAWNPSGKVFYTNLYDFGQIINQGMYQVDAQTGNATQIMQFGDNKYYRSLSVSSSGRYILGERVDSRQQQVGSLYGDVYMRSSIWLIDLYRRTETKIELE